MTDEVHLRRMHWTDIEPVAALDAASFGADAWTVEFFWSQLAIPGNRFVVAVRADEIAGFAGIGVSGPQADILTIAVAASVRGQGLGTRLLNDLVGHARSRGVEAVYLDVRADNEAAIGLYERHGFEAIGRRPGYYRSADADTDAIIMRALIGVA